MGKDKETFFIIDGSSVMYRAFHAVPQTFTSASGMPTNAVYGFTQTLRKIIHDFGPHYIGVAFDVKGPSLRHALFNDYKAERPPMPDSLSVQVPYIKEIVRAFNIPVIEMEGYEADDVIASLVKMVENSGFRVALITGDKDMYQLVDENTFILDYLTGKEYGPAEVREKFGVGPEFIRDLIGLAGDTSDNIPGVPKVGLKTAAKLLNQFGSFEAIFERVSEVSGEKLKENLTQFKDQAVLSRELATLHYNVPMACTMEDLKYKGPDFKLLEPLLVELDFRKVLKEMLPEMPKEEEKGIYRAILDEKGLEEALGLVKDRLAMTLLLTEEGMQGGLMGVAFATGEAEGFYCPAGGTGLTEDSIIGKLRPLLEDSRVRKDTDNSKQLFLYAFRKGITVKSLVLDTSLASYVLNPSRPGHGIEAIAYEYLNMAPEEKWPEDLEGQTRLSGKKACYIFKLSEILKKELEDTGLYSLYSDMELPLSSVLAGMELAGIKVDRIKLETLSKEMEVQLASIEKDIYASAGMEFNINSPKQLSEVLFERLKLKPLKKTKTGFSTDEEVLTQLALGHDVPRLIIGFRQLAKLKSTYVDALQTLINPSTGRIHTSFNQTVTATGRLSSSRPNLQNIPVRGEAAARIREAFVAEEGSLFISADYSQIELRIAAHMSGDPILKESFIKGEDIHTRTACEVFGVMEGLVTSEMRRRAKAINFGIIYGMGPFGLSTELGISMREATEYINRYFDRYRAVKLFIDRTIEEASSRGYTVTLFGRRRFIPELKSTVDSTVRLGQRLAINTPIQGSAADMIKAAMINIDRRLKEEGLKSRMILQIHDELIFEAVPEEKDRLISLVKAGMEGVIGLEVPVIVNLKSGLNWNMVE